MTGGRTGYATGYIHFKCRTQIDRDDERQPTHDKFLKGEMGRVTMTFSVYFQNQVLVAYAYNF